MLSIGLVFENFGELTVPDMIKFVKLAEAKNFDIAWIHQHPLYREALISSAIFTQATQKIKIGLGAISPYVMHPLTIAWSIATLDEASEGRRIIIAIGSGISSWIALLNPYHPQIVKPLSTVREAIKVIKTLLRGETVSCQMFKMQDSVLGFEPKRQKVPIYIAAMGAKMLQLAGQIADGVLLTTGSSVEYVKWAVKNIRIGADKTGRDPSNIDVLASVLFSVSEDHEQAEKFVRKRLAYLLSLPEFDPILAATQIDMKNVASIRNARKRSDEATMIKYLTDDLLHAFSACGTLEQCERKLSEYRSAGVKIPLIKPVGPDPKSAILNAICLRS